MKINWFSPLPPARTDIGHYTARILPALFRLAEVRLWTAQEHWNPDLEAHAEVIRFRGDQLDLSRLAGADVTFYNLGNNVLFHSDIWQASQHHPGVVVLHDLCLQDFFCGYFLNHLNVPDAYRAEMERWYGKDGLRAAEDLSTGTLPMAAVRTAFPLTPLALEGALGVLVHTEAAYTEFVSSSGIPCCCQPLPYAAMRPSRPARQLQLDASCRLIVFGYISENRQLDVVLDALASFPQRERLELDIYGELWAEELIRGKIAALDLGRRVRIHGFVVEQELEDALSRAHLALNLRYPTMGEASGSQLRLWDHALPSLVTQTGWYAELPESAVRFVRPGSEVADLHTHWATLLTAPETFAAMGQAGKRILEQEHAPQGYAGAVVDFSRQVARHQARRCAMTLAEKVGREMGRSLPSSANPDTADRVSARIHEIFA